MARSRRKRGRQGGLGELVAPSLTSLMDVVTIILVYFVKTFAVSPLTVQDPSVQLPISTSREAPEDSVVVMITGAERRVVDPNTGRQTLVTEVPTLSVDDDLVLQLGQNFEVPDGELDGQFIIRRLTQQLLEVRKLQGVTSELMDGNSEFSGKIVFVVDKNVPYRTLSKALVSSAQAGYADFKFAIVKHES